MENIHFISSHSREQLQDLLFGGIIASNIKHQPAMVQVGPVLQLKHVWTLVFTQTADVFAQALDGLQCVKTSVFIGIINQNFLSEESDSIAFLRKVFSRLENEFSL